MTGTDTPSAEQMPAMHKRLELTASYVGRSMMKLKYSVEIYVRASKYVGMNAR